MNPSIPFFISAFFMATTVVTLYLFSKCDEQRGWITWAVMGWLILQGAITWSGFYLVTDTIPPRFALLGVPVVLCILTLLVTRRGRTYFRSLPAERLMWIHVVRVPVEITLYWLFVVGQVPEVMTFQGNNFDIFSGITAPLVVLFGYKRKILTRSTLIMWNLLCLVLLFNIVIHAILAAPTVFQQIAFDQPNRGILYFPFSWLPAFIVPAVLYAHIGTLVQLFSQNKK